MEMRQVGYFLTLCETLNFTRAAERCKISQPSLTRAIQALEHEFGGHLFLREGGRTRLTELGRMIKPHLDQVHGQADAAAAQAREFHESSISRLRLGLMCTVAPTDLVQLIESLRARHPQVRLSMSDTNAQRLTHQLENGDLDIAIMGAPERLAQSDKFHYLPLYREQFLLAYSNRHRLNTLSRITCHDLHNETGLLRSGCEMSGELFKVMEGNGTSTHIALTSDRDDWILAMAAANLGYTFMPSRSVTHPGVSAAPLDQPEFWREVSLVSVRGRPHSPAVGALIREAMRIPWLDDRALAVRQLESQSIHPG